jgi:hypothetical protein
MFSLAIANERILAKDKTARIVYPIVVQIIPVPVRGTTGG